MWVMCSLSTAIRTAFVAFVVGVVVGFAISAGPDATTLRDPGSTSVHTKVGGPGVETAHFVR